MAPADQQRQPARKHTLLYSTQCPNCVRFIDALKRTSAAATVSLVDVATLTSSQLASVQAVPAMVLADGQTMYGTKAFEWLKDFDGDVELEGFHGGGGALPFSDVEALQGYATYAESFSAFEPVRD